MTLPRSDHWHRWRCADADCGIDDLKFYDADRDQLREALEKYGWHQHEWVPTPSRVFENGAWRDAVEPEEGWDRTGVRRFCPDEETGECWCGFENVLALIARQYAVSGSPHGAHAYNVEPLEEEAVSDEEVDDLDEGPVPATWRAAPCGECPVAECDHCQWCDYFAGLPGAREHDVTVYPAGPEKP